MKLARLFTQQQGGTYPWALEASRTFHCPCGHKWTLPEDALQYYHDGKATAFVMSEKHFTGRCPECNDQNYEMLSFMQRYELLTKEERKRTNVTTRGQELDFGEGFISCEKRGDK